ncbi:hypothetical protein ACLOJK_025038 [Asimina triloba]
MNLLRMLVSNVLPYDAHCWFIIALDICRLALKAFTDQKRRFFPHLEDEQLIQTCGSDTGAVKKQRSSQLSVVSHRDENSESKTLSDVLIHLEKEVPNMKVFTYQRLDWLKRATSLSSSGDDNIIDPSKEQIYHSSNRLRTGTLGAMAADQVAVLELLVPSVFRAIVSLHPAGSVNPDAVAFFSPDEEHANKALQYFLGAKPESSLDHLLQWISNYETLFTKVCSKCRRLVMMDKLSALLLPPVHRPYRQFSTAKMSPSQPLSQKDQSSDSTSVYHIGCSSDET